MEPTRVTTKTLFALSCNRCAFPGCDLRLADPAWGGVRADIAHIRGERPGAPRYDSSMTDDERRSFENLMLLCPNHHREVDRLRPDEWPVDRLLAVKAQHEQSCSGTWASEAELEFYSALLELAEGTASPPPTTGGRPRLVLERDNGDAWSVVNVGDGDAFEVRLSEAPTGAPPGTLIFIDGHHMARLSPGARWVAVMYARAFGDEHTPAARVHWSDASGQAYDADFPV